MQNSSPWSSCHMSHVLFHIWFDCSRSYPVVVPLFLRCTGSQRSFSRTLSLTCKQRRRIKCENGERMRESETGLRVWIPIDLLRSMLRWRPEQGRDEARAYLFEREGLRKKSYQNPPCGVNASNSLTVYKNTEFCWAFWNCLRQFVKNNSEKHKKTLTYNNWSDCIMIATCT